MWVLYLARIQIKIPVVTLCFYCNQACYSHEKNNNDKESFSVVILKLWIVTHKLSNYHDYSNKCQSRWRYLQESKHLSCGVLCYLKLDYRMNWLLAFALFCGLKPQSLISTFIFLRKVHYIVSNALVTSSNTCIFLFWQWALYSKFNQ